MAIKQERILSLLRDFRATWNHATRLHSAIRLDLDRLDASIANGEALDAETVLSVLRFTLNSVGAPVPSESLLGEEAHFRLYAKRNLRERERIASRRFMAQLGPQHPLSDGTPFAARARDARSPHGRQGPPRRGSTVQVEFPEGIEEADAFEPSAGLAFGADPTPDQAASQPVDQKYLDLAKGDMELARQLAEDARRYPAKRPV